jgi:hypothetical protein
MRLTWVVAAAASVLLGCAAQNETVSDNPLARLPARDQAALATRRQAVAIAEWNLSSAQVALDEARQEQAVAQEEERAAETQLDRTRQSASIARNAYDPALLADAQANRHQVERALAAAETRRQLADGVAELRRAQLDADRSQLELVRANLEIARAQVLDRNGMAAIDPGPYVIRRQAARRTLASDHRRVVEAQARVTELEAARMRIPQPDVIPPIP